MAEAKYNRIKSVLAEKSKTNKLLATQLNVRPQTVSNWCRNVRQPSLKQLYEIAKALNVEAKDLIPFVKDVS
jgi:transcriptional regulator with XRE-family HTH domain